MKPQAYSQVYLHMVFSPKGRESLLNNDVSPRIYAYIAQAINDKKHKTYIVNGMPDHIHILVGINTTTSISDLVRDIKRSSSLFINSNKLIDKHFSWQEGFGVFSYGKSQIQTIYDYISNQKKHHDKINFKKEYESFLNLFNIEYDENCLFEFYE